MDRKWIFFAFLIIGVSAATAQQDDDYLNRWWSDVAQPDQLGKEDTEKDLSDNDQENPLETNFYEDEEWKDEPDFFSDESTNDSAEDDDIVLPYDMATALDENEVNKDDIDGENTVLDDIKQYRDELEDPQEESETFDDYQIEDNRSKVEDDNNAEEAKEEAIDDSKNVDEVPDEENNNSNGDTNSEDVRRLLEQPNSPYEEEIDSSLVDNSDSLGVISDDDIANEDNTLDSQNEPNHDLLSDTNSEEVKRLLEEENSPFEEDIDENVASKETQERVLNSDEDDFDAILDNFINSLREDDDEETEAEAIKFLNDMVNADDDVGSQKENINQNAESVDTIDKIESNEQQNQDDILSDKSSSSESVNDDDTVAKAYADLQEDLTSLYDTWKKLSDDTEEDESETAVDIEENEREDVDTDVNEKELIEDGDFNYDDDDEILDAMFKDEASSDVVNSKLLEDNVPASEDNELSEQTDEFSEQADKQIDETVDSTTFRTIDVKDLTSSEYDNLMTQFSKLHDEVNPDSELFAKNIAAVNMDMSADEVTEITSPNYPNTYPTNNVVDWILKGEGTGVELNITDLQLRGAQDDFLLIIPGGLDASSSNGLIFSYYLNEPRKFRFTEVNQVFIRFQSGGGLGFLRGFKLTAKSIWPPQEAAEPIPEPEALLPPPVHTFRVTLGGLSHDEFQDVKDEFQRLLADMATMYIHANNIDMGQKNTSEVTNITRTAVCNINWPNYQDCVEVTFGVPLVYEDEDTERLHSEDLRTMWETYVPRDPFAARLRSMGITEFAVPNDGRVILAWVMLAGGVIVAAVLLSLALWRYSCFEDYTRMKSFSDTDSLREEKRGLDLYPTPHQNLPPLYSEYENKWTDQKYDDSTRVDLGGFANRSYIRDDMFDMDSDDDAIPARDRYTTDV